MTVKGTLLATGILGVLVLLVIGLTQLGHSAKPARLAKLSPAEMRARLTGSPAPLAELHAQAGEVLSGGLAALRGRLDALRGRPVVVNKWASWCQPCRAEFGVFQHVSVSDGRTVAFIGVDSGDTSRGDAQSFLRSFPLSYPSYYDASGQAGLAITDSTFTPVTAFFNRSGKMYVKQGPYLTTAKLEQDVRRYALDG